MGFPIRCKGVAAILSARSAALVAFSIGRIQHWWQIARMDGVDPDPGWAIPHGCGFGVDPYRISRMPAGAADKTHNGTDVDDRPATGLHHLLSGEFCAEEHAGLVDADDTMPAFQ